MSAFEFVFSLFGLLLGFSLVEVLGGLARAVGGSRKRPLGWLTPMLAIYVMLDVTGFWSIAWVARDFIPVNYAALVVGLAITGLYYMAAYLVFPGAEDQDADLDGHYFDVKSKVFAAILMCQLLAHGSRFAVMGTAAFAQWPLTTWILMPVYLAILASAIFVRGRTVNFVVLLLLILLYLQAAIASVL
jgi:hypothetical protein